MYQQELRQGNTGTMLLTLLEDEPMYGYRRAKEVDKRSSGYFAFEMGDFYPALHRALHCMKRDHLVEGQWMDTPNGVRRRYRKIAAKSRGVPSDRLKEWRRFTRTVNSVMLAEAR